MLSKSWTNIESYFTQQGIRLTSLIPQKTTVLLNISAQIKDIKITVENKYVGRGKNKTLITRTCIIPPHSIPQFKITRENIFTKIGETLGWKDTKTGDVEFDKRFRLTMNKAEIGRVFTNELMSEFLTKRKDLYGTIECNNDVIEIIQYGVPGYKIGFKQFTNLFELGMKIAGTKPKVMGHSPGSFI